MAILDMGVYRARYAEGYSYKATENQKADHPWGVAYEGEADQMYNEMMEARTVIRWEDKFGLTEAELANQTYVTRTDTLASTRGARVRFNEQKYNQYDGSGPIVP